MPSLLVIVFLVEAAVRLIDAVGAATLNNILWTAINFLPVPTSKAAAQQRKLQAEYLRVRRDMNATSSQDEFAKWAKIRRQHDKLLEQLETSKKSMETSRSSFDNYLTAARLLLTRAPQYIIPFWYAKQPMFWLPYGWFPYYAEWLLSFPRAPVGSVSIASWQLACAGIVALLSEVVTLVLRNLVLGGKQTEAPVKAGNASRSSSSSTKKAATAAEEKTS